jgi:hypothetical protein
MEAIAYLIELTPWPRRTRQGDPVAAKVARFLGPRSTVRLATPSSLADLAARRLGVVRFTRPL